MSLLNSLPQLEQAFRELQDNFKKSVDVLQNAELSVAVLQGAVDSVIQTALSDNKTPLKSELALQQIFSSTRDANSFDVIIYGDINRFKLLNDNYGHAAGDYVIGEFGTMIQKLFVDKYQAQAFRPHGDEFVILLKREFLEDFKTQVNKFAKCEFEFEEQQINSAMSFGFAVREGETDFETLRNRADAASQEAKEQGDGICIKWSKAIERNALISFRERCQNCGAKINCDVPQQNAPGKLKRCPCCDELLIRLPEKETRKATRRRNK